jgi:AAA+ superfamily predicted ATPase
MAGDRMNKEELIGQVLLLPFTAMDYHLGMQLQQIFPGKAIVEVDGGSFNVESYARAGKCTITRSDWSYNQIGTYWYAPEPEMIYWQAHGPRVMHMMMGGGQHHPFNQVESESTQQATLDMLKKAWIEVQWGEETLDILIMHIEGENSYRQKYWILTEVEEVARAFLADVCAWNTEIRSEVLVFDGGQWYKDEKLFRNIQGISFDGIILKGDLKKEIREDLEQFFASRDVYEEHDIPWKRGILFIGPAGNGKTQTVKALINTLGKHCLYVKSFRAPHTQGADEVNIRQVFDRARRSAPCVLILEDLDSLITPQNRSFFLNELDGFAANIGIVTLATTNHPERLDPAILDRPSRFDRKYHFDLPELAERLAYISLWNEALSEKLRLSDQGKDTINGLTDGFSFAYLKELFLSSKMRWIAQNQQRSMEEVMVEQAHLLREQMTSAQLLGEAEPEDEGAPQMGTRAMFMHRRLMGPQMP